MRIDEYIRQQLDGAVLLDARVMPALGDPAGMTYVAGRGRLSRGAVPFLMKRVARLRKRLEAAGLPHVVVSLSEFEMWAVMIEHAGTGAADCRRLIASIVQESDLMQRRPHRPGRNGTGGESNVSQS